MTVLFAVGVVGIAGSFVFVLRVSAASYTWDGGGTTNNWSDCANWSTNVYPVAADNVVFNATSTKNSVVDAAFAGSVNGFNMAAGYTGAVSLARTLAVNAYTQAAGTFDGTGQTLDINGAYSLSNGSFIAPTNTYVQTNFTISGGTFSHNAGIMTFDGGNATLSCNNVTFNSVVLAHTSNTKTIGTNCNLPLGANPAAFRGVVLNGTLTGTGTLSTVSGAAMTIGATGVIVGFTNQTYNGSIVVQSGANYTAPSGDLTVYNAMTLTAPLTFNHNSGRLVIAGTTNATIACGNVAFNTAIFTHTNGIKTIAADCNLPIGTDPTIPRSITLNGALSGSGALTLAGAAHTIGSAGTLSGFNSIIANNSLTLNAATLNLSSYTTVDFNGNLLINAGSVFTAPSGTMSVAGNFTIDPAAIFNHNGGTLVIDGSTSTIACGNALLSLVQLQAIGTKTIQADCTLPLGNDPVLSGSQNLYGTLSGSGTMMQSANSNVLTLYNTGIVSGFTRINLFGLTLSGHTNGLGTVNQLDVSSLRLAGSANLETTNFASVSLGEVDVATGSTFAAPSGTLTLKDSARLNVDDTSTFTHNNGTVTIIGQWGRLSGNITFFNLTNTAGRSLAFQNGKTVIIEGSLTLKGREKDYLSLYGWGSTSGSNIDPRGPRDIEWVVVQNSTNINAQPIVANNSLDRGNNTNWSFNAPIYGGYAASDVIGQPDFTQNSEYEGSASPTAHGFGYQPGAYVDEAGHRLFVPTCGSRIMVFDLDQSNTLTDKTADFVLGKSVFTNDDSENSLSANTINCPLSIAYDEVNKLLFAGDSNNRILIYDISSGITNGMDASYILGQPDFVSANDAVTAAGLTDMWGDSLAYDPAGKRLFVADTASHRVLIYDLSAGITNGMDASYVLGQLDFTTATSSSGANGFNYPGYVEYDPSTAWLYVSDVSNHRVMVFDLSGGITNGMDASHVLGQPDMNTTTAAPTSASSLDTPSSLALDEKNKLLTVNDYYSGRTLIFDVADITNNEPAIMVLGQEDMTLNRADYYVASEYNFTGASTVLYFDSTNRRYYMGDETNYRILVYDFVKLAGGTLPIGRQGSAYTGGITSTQSQGSVTYSLVSGTLPTGLVLNSTTGQILGTPTQTGTFSFRIRAVDDNGAVGSIFDEADYTMTIEAAPTPEPEPQNPPAVDDDTDQQNSGQLAQTGLNWIAIAVTAAGVLTVSLIVANKYMRFRRNLTYHH